MFQYLEHKNDWGVVDTYYPISKGLRDTTNSKPGQVWTKDALPPTSQAARFQILVFGLEPCRLNTPPRRIVSFNLPTCLAMPCIFASFFWLECCIFQSCMERTNSFPHITCLCIACLFCAMPNTELSFDRNVGTLLRC